MTDQTGVPPEGTDIEEPADFVPPEVPWLDPGPLIGHEGLEEVEDAGDPENPEVPVADGFAPTGIEVSQEGGL